MSDTPTEKLKRPLAELQERLGKDGVPEEAGQAPPDIVSKVLEAKAAP